MCAVQLHIKFSDVLVSPCVETFKNCMCSPSLFSGFLVHRDHRIRSLSPILMSLCLGCLKYLASQLPEFPVMQNFEVSCTTALLSSAEQGRKTSRAGGCQVLSKGNPWAYSPVPTSRRNQQTIFGFGTGAVLDILHVQIIALDI